MGYIYQVRFLNDKNFVCEELIFASDAESAIEEARKTGKVKLILEVVMNK